jgi:N-dimethylarginine dimethylaminohydrolase
MLTSDAAVFSDSDGGIDLIPGYRHRLTTAGIGEWNLWGRLREVAVGTAKDVTIPQYEPLFDKYVEPGSLDLIKRWGGAMLEEAAPDLVAAFEREGDELVRIYESFGVKVHRPRAILPQEMAYSFGGGANNMFPCDAFWPVGRNIIETSWRKKAGWPAKWATRETYQSKVDADPAVLVQSCPLPAPATDDGDYYFEVGDLLTVGDGNVIVAYGEDGTSSNLRGCEWVKRALEQDGFAVTIHRLPRTALLHLYAVICIVGPGTVIAYEDAFPGRVLPAPLEGWDVIWCDEAEARATAPCAVNIDRNTVVMPSESPKTNQALRDRGFEVVDLSFATHASFSGGLRCATGVIHREID